MCPTHSYCPVFDPLPPTPRPTTPHCTDRVSPPHTPQLSRWQWRRCVYPSVRVGRPFLWPGAGTRARWPLVVPLRHRHASAVATGCRPPAQARVRCGHWSSRVVRYVVLGDLPPPLTPHHTTHSHTHIASPRLARPAPPPNQVLYPHRPTPPRPTGGAQLVVHEQGGERAGTQRGSASTAHR